MENYNEIVAAHNKLAESPEAKELVAKYKAEAEAKIAEINSRLAAEGKPLMKWYVMCIPTWILHIPSTQREPNMTRIAKIKSGFKSELMQIKTVCVVNGLAEIADGLHTMLGSPYDFMFVRFFPDSTAQEVAYLLAHQHDNTSRINGIVMYRCNLFCGCKREVEIDNLLTSRKITVKHTVKNPLKRNVNAIAKLLQVYKNYGINGVELVVDIILDAGWVSYDAAFNTQYLEIGRTLCEFAVKNDANYIKVRDSMKAAGNPNKWEGWAREMYPDNRGQHGERSLVDYTRHLCGLI